MLLNNSGQCIEYSFPDVCGFLQKASFRGVSILAQKGKMSCCVNKIIHWNFIRATFELP